jgi:hypothetical protein
VLEIESGVSLGYVFPAPSDVGIDDVEALVARGGREIGRQRDRDAADATTDVEKRLIWAKTAHGLQMIDEGFADLTKVAGPDRIALLLGQQLIELVGVCLS